LCELIARVLLLSSVLLFKTCLLSGRLKTAGSYLLVLHNLEQLDGGHTHAARLLTNAVEACDWQLCRELLRFLHSIDDSGAALRHVLSQTNLVPSSNGSLTNGLNKLT
jgi:RAB6A-GEF complex partner protein 1